MTLQEILESVHEEIASAGVSPDGVTLKLSFAAKKDRTGEVSVDFVDAGAMSKPRTEDIHRLSLPLANASSIAKPIRKVESLFGDNEKPEGFDEPPALRRPPSLPPKRPT